MSDRTVEQIARWPNKGEKLVTARGSIIEVTNTTKDGISYTITFPDKNRGRHHHDSFNHFYEMARHCSVAPR
jgi:hypothetical protein